ncbi:hypothetical protein SAMN05444581_11563 [Methylocapsa palsarum]|uniref:Uncharacterized protein n=1 Tax=Methylocapsa palsarum TaxID=1612308 RepID=A0A1I4BLD8_9HYPH|nr:hypothetical protein SAMN05444581_11563 [Methylocapsa palsarum]
MSKTRQVGKMRQFPGRPQRALSLERSPPKMHGKGAQVDRAISRAALPRPKTLNFRRRSAAQTQSVQEGIDEEVRNRVIGAGDCVAYMDAAHRYYGRRIVASRRENRNLALMDPVAPDQSDQRLFERRRSSFRVLSCSGFCLKSFTLLADLAQFVDSPEKLERQAENSEREPAEKHEGPM